MTFRNLLIFLNGALLLALVGQLAVRHVSPPRALAYADWAYEPESVDQVADLAGMVVHAKVVQIRKTRPIIVKVEGEPRGVDRIPAEIVTLQLLDDAVKGNRGRGSRVEVFRTGHSDQERPMERRAPPRSQAPPKPDDGIDEADAPEGNELGHGENALLGLEGDPPYEVGEEYVLFLAEGPSLEEERGGRAKPMRIVSPEGRFRVTKEGLQPMSGREFAQSLRGKPAREIKEMVRGSRGPG